MSSPLAGEVAGRARRRGRPRKSGAPSDGIVPQILIPLELSADWVSPVRSDVKTLLNGVPNAGEKQCDELWRLVPGS